MTIFITILIVIIAIIIIPFLLKRKAEQKESFYSLNSNIQDLIVNKKAEELAKIIVNLELEKRYKEGYTLLQAIEYKGMSFSYKVDKIRNILRIKAGLGPLKGP
jgi:hypothetical protein